MANITYTITQDGEEISYTINDGVGPVGPAGPNNITTATETDITGILKGDGANVSAAVEDTDYQGVPAEGAFVDGDKTKLDGIEAGADVTDAANVDAAGAVMESDYSPAHSVLAQQSGTGSPSSVTLGTNSLLGRASGAGTAIQGLTAAQARTLLNVEDGATADQTAAEILTAIKTVDGTGSGLDADLLDGQEASAFAAASHTHTASDLDFAGSTDIGADLADADEILVSDGGGNTTRVKSALSRFWTYIKAKIESVGLSSLNITGDLTVDTNTLQVNSTTNEVTIAQDLYSQSPILVVNGFSGFDGGLSTFSVNAGTWSGSLFSGNQSFSGQVELTGQAASTDDSAMTRSLVDTDRWIASSRIWSPSYAFALSNSGTGSQAITIAGELMAQLDSGTSNSGYGKARLARGLNSSPGYSGAGIYFQKEIGISLNIALVTAGTEVNVFRIIAGTGSGAPAVAGTDPISDDGFGVEVRHDGTYTEWRVFGHNGTTLTTSAWTNLYAGARLHPQMFAVYSDASGNVTAYNTSYGGNTYTTITTTGGPTTGGASATAYASAECVNSASGTTSTRCKIYDVKFYTP